jgi:alkylation response protein AidB-like acyl-CoA dehydrogenase
LAKWFATEASSAAPDAVQGRGAVGYSDEHDVERHRRNTKGASICEGTSQNRELLQAGHVLRLWSDALSRCELPPYDPVEWERGARHNRGGTS